MGGQAKRRGTYEHRVAQAKARNEALEAQLRALKDNKQLVAMIDRQGIQRVTTRLIACGMLRPIHVQSGSRTEPEE